MNHSLRAALVLMLTATLAACATRTVEPYVRPAPEHTLPAKPDGAFASLESAIRAAHGPDASGFELLDRNADGLRWRLALIDSAKYSIDVQYYLWYGDDAGRILAKRLLDASDRGVKVRMLVDDINTLLSDAGTVELRDKVAAWIDAYPNFEIRLFNPWSDRDIAGRIGEMAGDLERLNQRMHNKALIVDNRAAILGGRNIGNEYLGLNATFNFHDLDVLAVGPVARQASAVFDSYWNSDWVMPVSALKIPVSQAEQEAARSELLKRLEQAKSLADFPIAPRSWSAELAALGGSMHIGTSRVVSDVPESDAIDHVMVEQIHSMMGSAQRELLILNAYIIPSDRGIAALRGLKRRGVDMKIVTNSLASHDVPAVNSHYKQWRKPILEAGAELYEIRHDAAIQPIVADTPPTRAEFMGLHAKGMVVDRVRVYIGSMNYDPRSGHVNTEMGAFIESPALAEALAKLIERDAQPANSWQVELVAGGGLRWVDDKEVVTSQPARNWWQRVEDVIFMAFPKDLY
ncbi:MAG: phospholipase D family protein [Betaproteobacteria bacterium]|nr:phospholipase D family protein [Betaproteobacteria bacterium]